MALRWLTCLAVCSLAGAMAGSNRPAAGRSAAGPRSKVLLIYDLEGVRTPVSNSDVRFASDTYGATQESLTDEVNAAIAGLIEAGAAEVVIADGHASGNPEPDYLSARLPKGSRLDLRNAPYDPYLDAPDASYAAMVAIGMHCGAAGKGFVCHTLHGHTKWTVGGLAVDESAIVAASAGRFDTPLILVTGDDALRAEVAGFSPATRYVVTKTVKDGKATPRARDAVLAEIRSAAEEGYRNRAVIQPWRFAPPGGAFESHFSYIAPEMAAVALEYPGTAPVNDKTVSYSARTFEDAYLAFRALGAFTTLARFRRWVELERETPAGAAAVKEAQERWNGGRSRDFTPTADQIDRLWSSLGKYGYQ